MSRLLAISVLFLSWYAVSTTDMVFVSEKVVTPEQAHELGIHRLVSGNNESWNVLVYPSENAKNEHVVEASVTFHIDGKEVALVLSKISDFEQTNFKRSDIVLDINSGVTASLAVTYGSQRLVLNDITKLKVSDYETFAMQYNKRLNSDND
jgi:hypothetical protein